MATGRTHIIPMDSRQAIAAMILRAYATSESTPEKIAKASKIRRDRVIALINKLSLIHAHPERASAKLPHIELLSAFCQGMGYNLTIILRQRT